MTVMTIDYDDNDQVDYDDNDQDDHESTYCWHFCFASEHWFVEEARIMPQTSVPSYHKMQAIFTDNWND